MIYMFLFDPKVQGQIIFSLNILKEKNMTYFTSPWKS